MRSDWLQFSGEAGGQLNSKTAFDTWITERYCLYGIRKAAIYRYEIHHLPWLLKTFHPDELIVRLPDRLKRNKTLMIDAIHYSPGVQVLAWPAASV